MTVSHNDRRLADASWTKQRDEPSMSNPVANLGLRHLAANQPWGLRSESSSEIGTIAPAALALFQSDDCAHEGVAPSLDVCDVSIAKLAVTKRLADCGDVDSKGPFLNGYVRPDVIHQLLLRDDLTWAVGKIGQNIQRPISEGKHSTVAPEHPLANRKFKRAEPQLPVNYGALHVCQPNVGSPQPGMRTSVGKRRNCAHVKHPNARAAARPIPFPAPVTTATRPANCSGSFRKIALSCNFTNILIIQLFC